VLAVLRRARGIRGELVAESLGSEPERFTPGLQLTLLPSLDSEDGRQAELERCWVHQDSLVLKFKGLETRTEAEAIQGWFVCVREEERPPLQEGEYYLSDLVGCDLISLEGGRRIGKVTGWQDAGGQVILEVGEDLLVPFVPQICRQVDVLNRRIQVELPDGLEELNRK
jgi:16S rRNA processing protein RimM